MVPLLLFIRGDRLHYFEQMRDVRYEDYNIAYMGKNRYSYFGNGYTWTETVVDSNPVWYFDELQKDVVTGVKDRVGVLPHCNGTSKEAV